MKHEDNNRLDEQRTLSMFPILPVIFSAFEQWQVKCCVVQVQVLD